MANWTTRPDDALRILNAEPEGYSREAREILMALGELTERDVPAGRLADEVEGFHVLIVRLRHQVDELVFRRGSRLRAVVSATTGLDHIDLDCARRHGVVVLSLQGESEFLRTVSATAELTWALLLAVVRQVPGAASHAAQGGWDRDAFRGHDLQGRALGLVGLGRIGEMVASYGRAFGMTVSAYDPYRADWPEGVTRCLSLAELASSSSILSIHVPLTHETRNLVDGEALRSLPPSSVLLNTSRGGVLDEVAAAELIESGHLGALAVDVLRDERSPAGRESSPLLALARRDRRVLVTPHIGGATWESMWRTEVFMARKLADQLGCVGRESRAP